MAELPARWSTRLIAGQSARLARAACAGLYCHCDPALRAALWRRISPLLRARSANPPLGAGFSESCDELAASPFRCASNVVRALRIAAMVVRRSGARPVSGPAASSPSGLPEGPDSSPLPEVGISDSESDDWLLRFLRRSRGSRTSSSFAALVDGCDDALGCAPCAAAGRRRCGAFEGPRARALPRAVLGA